MFLQRRILNILDSIVGPRDSVLDGARNVLDIVLDLLFIGGSGDGTRANHVHEWLDALDE